MIVKIIRARARDRGAFDRAQRRWGPQPGLLAQFGGWSTKGRDSPDQAVVVALWEDDDAHRRFLDGPHDAIAAAQRPTWSDLAVERLDVAAAAGDGPLPSSTILRTARCTLRPGHREHALDVQREVWFPAMHEAGMAWGALAGAGERLLVLSAWPDRATHDAYRRDRVAGLRGRADVAADMASVEGDLVALEPGWWVGPATS